MSLLPNQTQLHPRAVTSFSPARRSDTSCPRYASVSLSGIACTGVPTGCHTVQSDAAEVEGWFAPAHPHSPPGLQQPHEPAPSLTGARRLWSGATHASAPVLPWRAVPQPRRSHLHGCKTAPSRPRSHVGQHRPAGSQTQRGSGGKERGGTAVSAGTAGLDRLWCLTV